MTIERSLPGEEHQTAWERWQNSVHSQANRVQWALRNFIRWAPGQYQEKPAGQANLTQFPSETIERATGLMAHYGLTDLPQRASYSRVLETLTYLDWLDGMANAYPAMFTELANLGAAQPLRWLDVGAKNWAYVEALSSLAQTQAGSHFQLDGVELDPHRRYSNWQTRGQAAQAFIQQIPQAAYHAGDIRRWPQSAHVITLFLPFIFEEPHLAWGLPLDCFKPQLLLSHVLQLLEPGGLLIIINQGEVEAQAQAKLLQIAEKDFSLEIKSLGQLDAPFIEYRYPRMGWLCRKVR